MQNISNKIPHFWTYNFLNNLEFSKRPFWETENPDPENLLSYCLETGASKKNKKGCLYRSTRHPTRVLTFSRSSVNHRYEEATAKNP